MSSKVQYALSNGSVAGTDEAVVAAAVTVIIAVIMMCLVLWVAWRVARNAERQEQRERANSIAMVEEEATDPEDDGEKQQGEVDADPPVQGSKF